MRLVETRDLDGPNIFLLQPAIKLELAADPDDLTEDGIAALAARLEPLTPSDDERASGAESLGDLLMAACADLHERAGSEDVLHMHGELLKARCNECGAVVPCREDLSRASICPVCKGIDCMRPHVVWFGEIPFGLDEISAAISSADQFVAIGTSGRVYPAASFVSWARRAGVPTLELNLEVSDATGVFHESRRGRAGDLVPAWVEEVILSAKDLG